MHFSGSFVASTNCTEWLRSYPMRTALGLDLDLEALQLCLENNINKVGADEYSRISLFHGNVLNPCEAILVGFKPQELRRNIQLEESDYNSKIAATEPNMLEGSTASKNEESIKADAKIPARDIICAFDYSCCCLHKRAELVLCFKHVLEALSKKGGIFFMDIYGGTSFEQSLRLQRGFPSYMYIWEQAEFGIIGRQTRTGLSFQFNNLPSNSITWQLKCPGGRCQRLETGFQSVQFWLREMPDMKENRSTEGFRIG
ncbi:uncharacterized protein LOC120157171 [Hibiscus syriacus]|uniref:uncharacterized protein LOC120157171 n=1 Tax=Hibiscus syriacus TaxID=106335 RepID=UPI001923D61C|nr:uncharacterized protein LOC120157171 [Hibiscus syriacus]